MKALDLYCGAGGASKGLAEAGFEVTGIDIYPQPRYPFAFRQADVRKLRARDLESFDLVWASPPCQFATAYARRPDHVVPALNLILGTRSLLEAGGAPYVIENVPGARTHLCQPFTLCGSMFGLDVRRHRLFETSFEVGLVPPCDHGRQAPRFPQATNRCNPRSTVEVGVWRIPLETQQKAMGGCEWMSREELSQAIPPAYARWIAERFLERY